MGFFSKFPFKKKRDAEESLGVSGLAIDGADAKDQSSDEAQSSDISPPQLSLFDSVSENESLGGFVPNDEEKDLLGDQNGESDLQESQEPKFFDQGLEADPVFNSERQLGQDQLREREDQESLERFTALVRDTEPGKSRKEVNNESAPSDLQDVQEFKTQRLEAIDEVKDEKPPQIDRKAFDEDRLLSDLDSLLASPDLSEAEKGEAQSLVGDFNFIDFEANNLNFEETSNFSPQDPDHPSLWPPLPKSDEELTALRNLLMSREISQLSYLSRQMVDPNQRAQAISQVITEALLLRSHRDEKLQTVLGPTVERIVTSSVRRSPETLANQIFPVIGPAIRRAISETFISMLQNFNSTLEMSLSLKGLKWRLEAFRVKKPFSEIVLLHTLLYHVEEIYLIHAETGLVLDHLVSEGGETRDADLVAGMFTAIQSFVKDSFSAESGDNLENLRFGERTIFLRRADPVYLACVVRGNPPASLNQKLQEALELMVVDCAEDLGNFKGDTEPFKKCRRYFEDFLQARYQEKQEKPSLALRLLPFSVIAAALLFFIFSSLNSKVENGYKREIQAKSITLAAAVEKSKERRAQNFQEAIDLLNSEPGIVVAGSAFSPEGFWEVVLLRDALAKDPAEILKSKTNINQSQVKIINRPFVSLDEAIVNKRIRQAVKPLEGVDLKFNGATGQLVLSGSAPLGWILNAREKALSIPGVVSLDATRLVDPRTKAMEDLTKAINGVVILFPTGKDEPIAEDKPKLIRAVDNIAALERLASEMEMQVTLFIYGHADSVGQDRVNFELSEKRTKTVAAMLYGRGSSIPIVSYGLGSQFSTKGEGGESREDASSRRIEFRVRLAQSPPVSKIDY
ncbi:MAG: OmpA family protein [Deltaproteobacteria bacterium]|jgi:OOP family OmpA-OmpF porin|nr:OmpA family protein [Deltaproteobacteria bacterium]